MSLLESALVDSEADSFSGNNSAGITNEITNIVECSKTRFGCCPDGWTEAGGPNGEDCDDGSGDGSSIFITSTLSYLGSLLNVVTGIGVTEITRTEDIIIPTVGSVDNVNVSTNCNYSEFGCCPNGKKEATGPRYYGCKCEDCKYLFYLFFCY